MIKLQDKTIDELKILAYDLMLQLETTRQNLQLVNQELSSRHTDNSIKIVPKKDQVS